MEVGYIIITALFIVGIIFFSRKTTRQDKDKRHINALRKEIRHVKKKLVKNNNHLSLAKEITLPYSNISDPVPAGTLKLTNYEFPKNKNFGGIYDFSHSPHNKLFYTSLKQDYVFTPDWTLVGVLTPENQDESKLLNFYQRSVAPYIDLYEYAYEDKDGFFVPLPKSYSYVKNGDIIDSLLGQGNLGSWKANIFINDRYAYLVS